MTKQTVKIFNDLKDNKAIKVDLSNDNLHICEDQAYTMQLTDDINCGVYRAYTNIYGQEQLLLDFTGFSIDKLATLKKKLNGIGAIKVQKDDFMFYIVSFNDHDMLNRVRTAAREALGLYKYVATDDGLGIVSIDYGIDDRVQFRDLNNPQKVHHAKINYSGNTNFKYSGQRYYLDTFIRTNIF